MAFHRNNSEHLKTEEVAEILGLTRQQVIRRIQQGRLEGGKTWERWYVMRDSVEAYQASQTAA